MTSATLDAVLSELLAAGVPSIDILAKTRKNGITDMTLCNTKAKIGVQAHKIGFGEDS